MGIMKKYKLGIIGFGSMASTHYKVISNDGSNPHITGSVENVEVKGVYDIDPKRQEAAHSYGLEVYPTQEALLADPEIELVLVATTNEVHKEIAIAAMAAGKHVVCEKPAAMSSAELAEMIEAAKRYNRIFTVDQNRRVNRDFVLMRRQVESGALGKVYMIESRVEGSRGMPSGWRTLKAQGGGMMLDWGVHLIDQIMYMIPEKVVNVFCKMYKIQYPEVEDNFRLIMTFESGLTAQIEVSTNNYITHPRWYVLGDKGTLVIDDWECHGKIVRKTNADDVWAEEVVYTAAGPTKTMAPRNPASTETIPLSMPEDVVDSLSVTYAQFTDAIEGKAPLTIQPEQALRVMQVMEAAFLSAEKQEAVQTAI